ncbi:hypothetical protein G6F50_015841 [Rhizopus delemar]|uniref:Uncharacterized protein n=1 Tax=Rhizopus delemar TaxID=936053 RepID=A0A9P7C335_9FUNG|nr:hypothetical protein G6F50_015841 [Rhizopus delemar]
MVCGPSPCGMIEIVPSAPISIACAARIGFAAIAGLHGQPGAGLQCKVQRLAGDVLRAGPAVEAGVDVQRIHPRGKARAADREGFGVGQRFLEAGGVRFGEVVAERTLRLQGGAGTGHRHQLINGC